MENIKMNVREEINDAEYMLNWLFDGTENEDWMNFEQVGKDGSLRVYDGDGNIINVVLDNFKVGCEGLVSVEYIGNGNYKVVVAETLDK